MIREITDKDLFEVNQLLQIFNVEYSSLNDFTKIVVYEKNNKIVGALVYSLIYDRIEIEYIVVSDEYKRFGIGTKLLKYIEKKGITNITLEVRESNTVAINFYKKNGYEVAAIRKNYYKNENGYLMIKNLGE